jgi:hypothetical protein
MDLILFATGLLAVLAGVVMVGFGIPINAFAIGNTLILAGIVSAVGGGLMVGLATVVRQLRGLADVMDLNFGPRSVGSTPADPESPSRARERTPRGWPGGQAAAEPAEILSGATQSAEEERVERRLVPGASGSPAGFERRLLRNPESRGPDADRSEADEAVAGASAPPDEQPAAASAFAPARPDGRTVERPRRVDSIVLQQAASRSAIARTSRQPQPTGGASPGVIADERPLRRHDKASPSGATPGSERTSILKSGVIDGMAYTLFADGSIEAELPQGTLKFDTIEQLRDYLATKK